MLILYNILFPLAMLVYLPVFVYKQLRRGNLFQRFGERFGWFSTAQRAALKRLKAPVWIHAVSVGEAVAALSFIRRWQQGDPEQEFVLSTTTITGQATAQGKLPERVRLIYCPIDFPFAVRRALRLIRPRMLIIFEVEYWPNLITLAARAGAKVALVNGRMSDRSAARYRKHAWFFGPLFRRFDCLCMQSEEDVQRVRAVVGREAPVFACSTMKFDQTPDMNVQGKAEFLNTVFGATPRLVWTAGSTHAGEEALVAETFQRLKVDFPNLKLILVPRHHERTGEVANVLRSRGLAFRLAKPPEGTPAATEPADVLLVNTTGELMSYYATADVAYVGKSLAGQKGGHNIIEPAIFAKPVICGANMDNFRLVVDLFRRQQAAVEVASDELLAPALRALLASPAARADLGQRARQVVEKNRGAIDRTLAHLQPLLEASPRD